jgi:hypothetical protein
MGSRENFSGDGYSKKIVICLTKSQYVFSGWHYVYNNPIHFVTANNR